MRLPNRLAFEKSPYLLQHKGNPVHWYPWGSEAFTKAETENKPIFLSIGYSTCYWCHVMENDSFEHDDVADILNTGFVSIKVDREERPDVDQLYMDTVVALSGHGGWPMSVFLTPNREPFWGGTFFYKDQFKAILNRIQEVWRNDRTRILQSATELLGLLDKTKVVTPIEVDTPKLAREALSHFVQSFDTEFGGFGSAPKFPPSMQVRFLLRAGALFSEEQILPIVHTTLEKMMCGGIYDQIGGGFHRYSVDERWEVPHYEKMLYDQALLTVAYIEAYQMTGEDAFAAVALEIIEFALKELWQPEGGFASALDAGEVGREGEFYLWDREITVPLLLRNLSHWKESRSPDLSEARLKLYTERNERPRPHLDTKILTGWNGLMIGALSKVSLIFGDSRLRDTARIAARFIRDNLFIEKRLCRSWCGGEARHDACLEDYAFLIDGLIDLAEIDGDASWIDWAGELQESQDRLLWKDGYLTSSAKELPIHKREFADGAVPSGNGVSARNLRRLFGYSGNNRYAHRYQELLRCYSETLSLYPHGVPYLLSHLVEEEILGTTGCRDIACDVSVSHAHSIISSYANIPSRRMEQIEAIS